MKEHYDTKNSLVKVVIIMTQRFLKNISMTVQRKRWPSKNIELIKHVDDPLKMGSSDSSDPKGIFMTLSNERIGIKIEFLELVGGGGV